MTPAALRRPGAALGGLTLCAALVLAAAPSARAQEKPSARIEVRVLAVTPAGVTLDAGADRGVSVGDRVELFPDGAPQAVAVVRVVTKQSARADWVGSAAGVLPGSRAEIVLTHSAKPQNQTASAPTHSPWTRPAGGIDANRPLLAPYDGTDAEPEPMRFRGRAFLQLDQLLDRTRRRNYSLARTGLDFTLENALGAPGALAFDGEIFDRRVRDKRFPEEDSTLARLDRLSYRGGEAAGSPVRYEVGRFLQSEFPELGMTDGAEVTFRPSASDRFGASAGLMPSFTPSLSSEDDAQGSVYYRHSFDEADLSSLGVAYQKTWHEGQADRDLVVLSGRHLQPDGLTLTGSAWIDYYRSGERTRSEGPELTQLFLVASHPLGKDAGLGATANYVRFQDILADELPPFASNVLAQTRILRTGVHGWVQLGGGWRASARADRWSDSSESGGSGEARLDVRDLLLSQGRLTGAIFASEGRTSSLRGFRLGAQQDTRLGSFGIGYDFGAAQSDFASGLDERSRQHILRASWDADLGRSWNLGAYVEHRFGTRQDTYLIGFLLSVRL